MRTTASPRRHPADGQFRDRRAHHLQSRADRGSDGGALITSVNAFGTDWRRAQKLVRTLTRHLEEGDLPSFERDVDGRFTREVLLGLRRQKSLSRASGPIRDRAATIVIEGARNQLLIDEAEEYARYVHLCLAVASARDALRPAIRLLAGRMPKLSMRQLLFVATRATKRAAPKHVEYEAAGPISARAQDYARRFHDAAGRANDLWFAVVRAVNECASTVRPLSLKRPDAIAKAIGPFNGLTTLCSQLNALDYALDSASFGDFAVTAHDPHSCEFKLDIVDVRRVLLRVANIRGRLMMAVARRKEDRFLRNELRKTAEGVLHNALLRFMARAPGPVHLTIEDMDGLSSTMEVLLLQVDGDDDLLWAAATDLDGTALVYHLSVALRLNLAVAEVVAAALPGTARAHYDDSIHLDDILSDLGREDLRARAADIWDRLTIAPPARSHWDLMRTPFLRTSDNTAQGMFGATGDTWSTVAREILVQGGDAGRRYGEIWEKFYASTFEDTGWIVVGRNVALKQAGRTLTEVDLLLWRGDLLLVVEIKALIGSGLNPYDHWKNREVIERGCHQAKLAAKHLTANRTLIASIASRKVADSVVHVQPLVLTTEGTFDGWEHAGVPVAGETIRKAITGGSKVEYYVGRDVRPIRTDWHLRPEDLSTDTILTALRDPINLSVSPEKGKVRHIPVAVAQLRLLVPDTGLAGDG